MKEDSLDRRIWREGKPKLTNDPETIQTMIAEFTENTALKKLAPAIFNFLGLRSVITAPIIAGDELIGMMDISRKAPFTETDLERMRTIAEDLATILQRRRLDQELKSSHAQLHALATHLQSVREDERTNLARELHDNLGQLLTGLKMQLSLMGETPTELDSHRVRDLRRAKTESLNHLIDKAIGRDAGYRWNSGRRSSTVLAFWLHWNGSQVIFSRSPASSARAPSQQMLYLTPNVQRPCLGSHRKLSRTSFVIPKQKRLP